MKQSRIPVTHAACYTRVSSLSDQTQAADIEHTLAERYPGVPVSWYRENTTTAKSRPAFDQMSRDAKAGAFQVVVIWSIDRLGRSMHDSIGDIAGLTAAGVRVVSCQDSWLDAEGPTFDLMLAIFSRITETERRRRTERSKLGRAHARANRKSKEVR